MTILQEFKWNDLNHKGPIPQTIHQGNDLNGNEIYPHFKDGEKHVLQTKGLLDMPRNSNPKGSKNLNEIQIKKC